MRRALLLHVTSAASFAACVAARAMWVRSYFVADYWTWAEGRSRACVAAMAGEAGVLREHFDEVGRCGTPVRPSPRHHTEELEGAITVGLAAEGLPHAPLGFAVSTGRRRVTSPSSTIAYLVVPFWFVGAMTAFLPAVAAGRWWRRARCKAATRRGRCPACDYDLRATPARCPECGAATSGEAARPHLS